MPQLGETVTEGTIIRWFKQVGDSVEADEILFEISTDKVDTEVPSPAAGVVTEILADEGDVVEVGQVLARVGSPGEAPGPAAELEPSAPESDPVSESALAASVSGPVPVSESALAAEVVSGPVPVPESEPVFAPAASTAEPVSEPEPSAPDYGLAATLAPESAPGQVPVSEPVSASPAPEPVSPVSEPVSASPPAPEPVSSVSEPVSASSPAPAPVSASEPSAPEPAVQAAASGPMAKVLSPVVRRLIAENDLDPDDIVGTGLGGRVTRADVEAVIRARAEAAAAAAPPSAETSAAEGPATASPAPEPPSASAPESSAEPLAAEAPAAAPEEPAASSLAAASLAVEPQAPSGPSSAAAPPPAQPSAASPEPAASQAAVPPASAPPPSAAQLAAPPPPAPPSSPAAPPPPAPSPSQPAPPPPPAPPPVPATARAAVPPALGPGDRVVRLNNIRRRTAEHMVRSKQTSPHVLTAIEIDYEGVEQVRRSHKAAWKAEEGFSLTYLPFICRAVVDALREYPHLNATFSDEGLIAHGSVNLAIAVDIDFTGLLAPVVKEADGKRLRQIARDVVDLAARARTKQLGLDDLTGGTFTLTNAGQYGTMMQFPIINQPQVAILSTDGVSRKPVVVTDGFGNESIAIHSVGVLAMAWDHRAFDGAYAAAFLHRVKEIIETRDWEAEVR